MAWVNLASAACGDMVITWQCYECLRAWSPSTVGDSGDCRSRCAPGSVHPAEMTGRLTASSGLGDDGPPVTSQS